MDFLELRDRLVKKAEEENAQRYRNIDTIVLIAKTLKELYPEKEFASTLVRVTLNFNIPKRDDKFIWLTTEEIFDLVGAELENSWMGQSGSYVSLQAAVEDVILDLTFYFAEGCTPIYEEVTERRAVGYRCK